jgi:hypothetical protein
MVTLMDLSPERLVTKPTMVLRVLREPGVVEDMAMVRLRPGGR